MTPDQMTKPKFRWIKIEPGLIGLDGYPIQIRRNPGGGAGLYTLLFSGREEQCNTLGFAKMLGVRQAQELMEFDLA